MVGSAGSREKKGRIMSPFKRSLHSKLTLTTPLLLTFTSLLSTVPLSARSSYVFESNLQGEALDKRVKEVVDQLDQDGYTTPEETKGFRYRLSSNIFSPFSYEVFTGEISSKNQANIIRVEGGSGDALLLARMLEQEGIINEPFRNGVNAQKVSSKSYLASQGLNLVAPWLAVFYNGHNSPRWTTNQMYFRSLIYFGMDLLLVSAAGTNLYKEKFSADKYGDRILMGLAITRMAGAIDSFQLVRGHNRMVELKYTYYFDEL